MKNIERRLQFLEQKIKPYNGINMIIFDSTNPEYNEVTTDDSNGKREIRKLEKTVSYNDFIDEMKQKGNTQIGTLLHICYLDEENMQVPIKENYVSN